jgi:hypothetical protein
MAFGFCDYRLWVSSEQDSDVSVVVKHGSSQNIPRAFIPGMVLIK